MPGNSAIAPEFTGWANALVGSICPFCGQTISYTVPDEPRKSHRLYCGCTAVQVTELEEDEDA